MKTPREILLQQHQAAAPKLDVIRAGVVAGLARPPARETASWREWLWPCPRAWTGLAAAWLVILGLNLATGKSPAQTGDAIAPCSNEALLEIRQQQQMLAKLISPPAAVEAEPPQPAYPRRSEIGRTLIFV